MTRFYEDDARAQVLLEEAEAAVTKLNQRLARLGGARRYAVLGHTSYRVLMNRRREGGRDGQASQSRAAS